MMMLPEQWEGQQSTKETSQTWSRSTFFPRGQWWGSHPLHCSPSPLPPHCWPGLACIWNTQMLTFHPDWGKYYFEQLLSSFPQPTIWWPHLTKQPSKISLGCKTYGHGTRQSWGKQRSGQQQDASLLSSLETSSEQFHSGNKDRFICCLIDQTVLSWPSLATIGQLPIDDDVGESI